MPENPAQEDSGAATGEGLLKFASPIFVPLNKMMLGLSARLRLKLGISFFFLFAFLSVIGTVLVSHAKITWPEVWIPGALFGLTFFVTAVDVYLKASTIGIDRVDEIVGKVSHRVLTTNEEWAERGLLLGFRFGRHSVSCGAIIVEDTSTEALPPTRSYRVVGQPETRHFEVDSEPRLKIAAAVDLITSIAERARAAEPSLRILGIGIGAPGYINMTEKSVYRGMKGFPSSYHVVEVLAESLAQEPRFVAVFGTADSEKIADVCLLDNDVRCATRRILSRHAGDPRWRTFAALHLGTGVGVGLVIEGQIQYGANHWAGELGHVDVGVSAGVSAAFGSTIAFDDSRTCTCGRKFHFEYWVNYEGLSDLARLVDPEMYDAIVKAFACVDDSWDPERIIRQGWPRLLSSPGAPGELPPAISERARAEWLEYLNDLCRKYAGLVAGGISCIVNMLDIDQIVLFGSLYEQLYSESDVSGFDQALRRRVRNSTPFDRAVRFDHHSAQADIWQGAALLSRDSAFLAARRGDSSSTPSDIAESED